jgi:hypothetical protein
MIAHRPFLADTCEQVDAATYMSKWVTETSCAFSIRIDVLRPPLTFTSDIVPGSEK